MTTPKPKRKGHPSISRKGRLRKVKQTTPSTLDVDIDSDVRDKDGPDQDLPDKDVPDTELTADDSPAGEDSAPSWEGRTLRAGTRRKVAESLAKDRARLVPVPQAGIAKVRLGPDKPPPPVVNRTMPPLLKIPPAAEAPLDPFAPQTRTGAPKIAMKPRVFLDKDKRINGIAFGRARTPSPFTGTAGDHTVAWTTVVDSVHAELYGLTLPQAVKALDDLNKEAQSRMRRTSPFAPAWNLTGDRQERRWRQLAMEDYAKNADLALERASELLAATTAKTGKAKAEKEAAEQVPGLLADALSSHLAFRNLLPFATVLPSTGAGAKGSGEGAARSRVIDVEWDPEVDRQAALTAPKKPPAKKTGGKDNDGGPADEPEPTDDDWMRNPDQFTGIDEDEDGPLPESERQRIALAGRGLWRMFDMPALVRAAKLPRVVSPERTRTSVERMSKLLHLGQYVETLLPGFKNDGPRTTTADLGPDYENPREFWTDVQVMMREVAFYKASDTSYQEGDDLVKDLEGILEILSGTAGKVEPETSQALDTYRKGIGRRLTSLATRIGQLEEDRTRLTDGAAVVLAAALRDHQVAVAAAYPQAVAKTGFLGGDPAKTAADKLKAYITRWVAHAEPDAVRALTDKVREVYPALGPRPAPARDGRWVLDSGTDDLVVVVKNDKVYAQGRPAGPPGVTGMGSHTTAWVTEVERAEKILADDDLDDKTEGFKTQGIEDLQGDLMVKLAPLLPIHQIEGGQLEAVFDAGLRLLTSGNTEDAITEYLSLRNLLPYATVNAGNKVGKGEKRGAASKNYDGASLGEEAAAKAGELRTGPRAAVAASLELAAAGLRARLKTKVDQDTPSWSDHPELRKAVVATAVALEAEAKRLCTASDPAKDVQDTITGTRKAENVRVQTYIKSVGD
jgi:hypothetical protein